jgi:type VI secretion system secreted protein Hcp
MAVDIFLTIQGLKGEALDHKHKDEFDIFSWSWGMNQKGGGHVGGGLGTGKVDVHDMTVTKFVDKGSPDLMLACCNGKHYDKAILTNRKAGEKPLEYYVVTMNDVIISNVGLGGNPNDERLMENITLNFSSFKVEYKEQLKTGGAGASPQMGWDIQGNTAK